MAARSRYNKDVMPAALEREIKLRFASPAAARAALLGVGGRLTRERRLQRDALLDSADGMLRRAQSALRVRVEADSGGSVLTFKGPVHPSSMKVREEIETALGDAPTALDILERLGFRVWFRYEKYREEFAVGALLATVDETPLGTFVELEGDEGDIARVARTLGFEPDAYVLDSYRGLYARHCEERGLPVTHMLFDA